MDENQISKLAKTMDAKIIGTHISWVLLTDDFAYKIKKPVKFSFLDFSTIEKRKHLCNEEVRLNSRLAPDVYLGVVDILDNGEKINLDEGSIVGHAIKMKRLPEDKRMDKLLQKGEVSEEDVQQLAQIIADFHGKVDVITDPKYNSDKVVLEQIMDLGNFKNTIEDACGLGDKVDFVLGKSEEFIKNNGGLFLRRQTDGRIRDCHGDLHSANIFLNEKPVIFDCIEFSEDFRYVDVASEVAFMAMDLDYCGYPEFSSLFVSEFLRNSNDPDLMEVLNLYKCYRANVRAKIAAIDYSNSKSDDAREKIRKYMGLAEEYAANL
jgi:hypothetical protein